MLRNIQLHDYVYIYFCSHLACIISHGEYFCFCFSIFSKVYKKLFLNISTPFPIQFKFAFHAYIFFVYISGQYFHVKSYILYIYLFHYGSRYHIETSPLICSAVQLLCSRKSMDRFLYNKDSVMKELNVDGLTNQLINYFTHIIVLNFRQLNSISELKIRKPSLFLKMRELLKKTGIIKSVTNNAFFASVSITQPEPRRKYHILKTFCSQVNPVHKPRLQVMQVREQSY